MTEPHAQARERARALVEAILDEHNVITAHGEGCVSTRDGLVSDLAPALTASAEATREGCARYRHKKSDSTYEVLGEAEAQVSTGTAYDLNESGTGYVQFRGRTLREGDKLVIYRSEESGKYYVRFHNEFHDGRFEPLPLPPQPEAGK